MKVHILILMICANIVAKTSCDTDNNDFPEIVYLNKTVNPCDDFYEYTCGNFKNIYPLDTDTLTIDHFTLLEDKLVKIANEILLEEDFDDDAQSLKKSKSAYKACVDLDYLNKVRNPEINIIIAENGFPLVERANARYSFNDIGDIVSRYGIPMLFDLIAFSNIADPNTNVLYISKLDASTLTPSEIGAIRPHWSNSYEELIEKGFSGWVNDNYASFRSNLKAAQPFDIFLRKMAFKIRNAVQSSLSDGEVIANIEPMVEFTRGVFQGGIVGNVSIEDFTQLSISLKDLNIWTKKQFGDSIPLDWVEFLQHLAANSAVEITEKTEIMTYTGFAKFLYGIINLVVQSDQNAIKNYVLMRIFTHLAPESDYDSRQYLEEYFKSMNYPILPRWKYCTRKIIDSVGTAGLSFALAYEYQLHHFNVNYFNQAAELIEDLQFAFKELMQNSTWMDDDSKSKALEKFDNMITLLGHPDVAYSKESVDKLYENLRICKWDNYGNSLRIKAFKYAYQFSQIAKRERAFWDKSPFEVNAYYNRPNNKIIFPISMLNPVFFGNKNRILDYGRIGSIIGHEMTHGFDKDGMKYAPDGALKKWWTDATMMEFTNRTTCFIDEYDQFYVQEIHTYVNGTITLNENIADNGGLRESYLAMKKMITKNNITKGTNEFTPEQLFFIGYGTLWCNNPSMKYLDRMKTNDHARSKYRVNGVVSNMEEFSKAFNCPLDSKMNPKDKCLLW